MAAVRAPRHTLDAGPGLAENRVPLPDGRSLRIVVAGIGNPLVVFEAGIGMAASMWGTVQPLVAAETRTLAYDRAGIGGSDADPRPRSLERYADDLDLLLDEIEPEAPAVLVGSSLGGAIIRMFASRHPQRPVGMVFVDPAMAEAMPASHVRRMRRVFTVFAALSHVGLHKRLMGGPIRYLSRLPMSDAARTVFVRDLTSGRNAVTARRDWSEVDLSASTLSHLQDAGLPDVPVTTLVGELVQGREPPGLREALQEAAREEMQAHPRGRFVLAARSGHLIAHQETDLVVEEILGVIRTVRDDER
jgi:pimeloyl-ACP methyl ester carboxylesterase